MSGLLPHHLVTDASPLTLRILVRSHHPAEYHRRDASSQSPTVINLSIDPLPSVSTSEKFFSPCLSPPPLPPSVSAHRALSFVLFLSVSSSRGCALPPLARRHRRRRSAGAVAIAFLEASRWRGCALPPLIRDALPSSTVRCPPPRSFDCRV